MQTTVSTKIVEKRNNCGGLKLLFLFNILIISYGSFMQGIKKNQMNAIGNT